MSAEIESLTIDRTSRGGIRSYSPMATALAVLGLLLAIYAHYRLGQFAERDDRLRSQVEQSRAALANNKAQIATLRGRLDANALELRKGLSSFADVPARIDELGRDLDDLRARAEAPQRAWVGAEASYLLELAARRLELEGDVQTAIAAMAAADARLATLKDPAIGPIREQLARELGALRAVPLPDLPGLMARLSSIEAAIPGLPVLGMSVSKGPRGAQTSPATDPARRARDRLASATRDLVSLRRVDPATARLVTLEEESLRREHLRLLLLSTRVAVMQRDGAAYTESLAAARAWLAQSFDPSTPQFATIDREFAEIGSIVLDPRRPDVGAAARMLQRLTRGSTPTS